MSSNRRPQCREGRSWSRRRGSSVLQSGFLRTGREVSRARRRHLVTESDVSVDARLFVRTRWGSQLSDRRPWRRRSGLHSSHSGFASREGGALSTEVESRSTRSRFRSRRRRCQDIGCSSEVALVTTIVVLVSFYPWGRAVRCAGGDRSRTSRTPEHRSCSRMRPPPRRPWTA